MAPCSSDPPELDTVAGEALDTADTTTIVNKTRNAALKAAWFGGRPVKAGQPIACGREPDEFSFAG